MTDDDPFGVFSDDEDDSDGSQAEETETLGLAQELMKQANVKMNDSTVALEKNNITVIPKKEEKINMSSLNLLELSWPAPLYKGPMELVAALPVGGGRGYVASKRLDPGTLILVESFIMEWPAEQLGKKLDISSVRHLLEHPNASEIIQDMEEFHPTKEQVDKFSDDDSNEEQISNMMTAFQSEYTETQVSGLVLVASEKKIVSTDDSPLRPTDIIRLLLGLRYNGLESGLYRHVAMLNHSCRPNCAKLLPTGEQSYSEVRTTQVVQPGESLTISYISRIMSHASRRKTLWEQHRFDIGANLKGEAFRMELIGNCFPSSSIQRWDETAPTNRIEKTTEELEKLHSDLGDDVADGLDTPDLWETVKALEQSSLELYTESVQQLKNDRHALLIPILLVHLEACELILKAPSLSTSTQLGILSRQVLTATRLLPLQSSYHGPDHFDLARTNLDLANTLGELLSRSPKRLYELNLPSLKSFEEWSAFEHKARKEHNRIKALYPHDAETLMKSTSSP